MLQLQCLDNNIDDFRVRPDDVKRVCRKLKSGKSDGTQGFTSDHLKHASDKLFVILAMLINSMLIHGYNPEQLLHCTVVSIPKDARGSKKSSDNYRGITLVNSICKLIDLLIIEKCSEFLYTSDLQFAFKSEHSTTLCTAVLTETVNYFVERNSNVYACLLDASKAFDKVQFGKLFTLLLNRNMPAVYLRLLLDSYSRQQIKAKWNNCLSTKFHVTNGVKQGGVLSPLLFIVYFDELITRLKNSGIGCNIGDKYIGALCYADDRTLLSPSVNGLSKLIRICEQFAADYRVEFNPKKTVGIQFGKHKQCNITINGSQIEWQRSVKDLGNTINSRLSDDDDDDCKVKCSVFIGNVNRFIGNYSNLNNCTKRMLYQAYCSSFYGSEIWSANSKGFNGCCTEWRTATRRVFNLPYKTHSYILGPLCGQTSMKETLHKRMLTFCTLY